MLHSKPPQPSAEDLLARAGAIAAGAPELAAFTRAIAELTERSAEARVGVLGLTGSGKSTLLNALMGEAILPEETCAASQLSVRCRRGPARRLAVYLKSGEVRHYEDAALTPERVAGYCAARLNPDNERGVAALVWTSPDARLPEGLTLVEASGLDGLTEGEEAAVMRLLPTCDAVLFVAAMRQPLKPAELRLIDHVGAYGQELCFVLSQADLERDTHQGGKLWRSRAEKLQRHQERFERQLAAETAQAAPDVVQVSSRLALAGREEAWRESGFEALLARLTAYAALPAEARAERRDHRALLALDRLLLAMPAHAADASSGPALLAEITRLAREVRTRLRGVPLEMTPRREQAALALLPLVAVFRELGFQRAFREVLEAAAPEAPAPRLLLVGAQRESHLRLAALLGHDLALLDDLEAAPRGTWLLVGDLDDFDPPGPAIRLPAPQTLLARCPLAIAPADPHLPPAGWAGLLARFDAVGLEVDLARPAIARADVRRAPYHEAIADAPDKLFYTCGHGAFLADRLDEAAAAASAFTPFGRRPFFVYEDYDARYTAFFRLVAEGLAHPRDLAQRWHQAGLPLDEPFSERQLHFVAQTLTQPTRGIS